MFITDGYQSMADHDARWRELTQRQLKFMVAS